MKIIKGSSIYDDIAYDMKKYAIEFYGKKYRNVIDKVYNETKFYEWKDETIKDIVSEVLEIDIAPEASEIFTPYYLKHMYGCHMLSINEKKNLIGIKVPVYEKIIMIKEHDDEETMVENLVHELYGHGACSVINFHTKIHKIDFYRNGISYDGPSCCIDRVAGEGFIQHFAYLITKLKYPDHQINDGCYKKAVEVATKIYECEGKEKIIKLMMEGRGNISKIFDKESPLVWHELSKLLNATVMEPNFKDNEKIDEMLKVYVKNKRK